jgi:hypothetical protein
MLLVQEGEGGTNDRFWTFFHQDLHATVLMRKTNHVVQVQWVNFHYMRKNKDATFVQILEACDFHGITQIMQFRYNWNNEMIVEFYSTLHFDKQKRIFKSITNGRMFDIKLSQFAEMLRMFGPIDNPKKLHARRVMTNREIHPMYVSDSGY